MSDKLKTMWDKTLLSLKAQVSEQTFTAWFTPIQPISLNDRSVRLGVPNDFFKDWVSERYLSLISSSLCECAGEKFDVSFEVVSREDYIVDIADPDTSQNEKKGLFRSLFPKSSSSNQGNSQNVVLNQKYSFENFVVGSSNRFSHAACVGVSDSPAKTYNPLFIHGGSGLGKTHLMHAIGNALVKKNPRFKISYVSSELFTNQLISAIQTRTMDKFRQKYRNNSDILLIDDIHFIAGKESTQQEFFHTFNSLYDSHKQIVMSSDRSPKEIPKLEERLVTRFEWGLVTDVQPPDFETRMAILKKKSEMETVHVSDEVFYFLAENIKTNIRELEGGLIRVVAYSKLLGHPVSVDLAKEVLKGMIKEVGVKVNVSLIQKKVAEFFSINLSDMKAKKRTKNIVYPRQIAMYLSRDMTSLSLPEIGAYFGGRHHTTVLHACSQVEADIEKKDDIKKTIDQLKMNIKI